MKQFAFSILSAALLCAATTGYAGDTGAIPAPSAAAVPAEAESAATWLLLAEISVSDGEVTALQSCLDQDRVASMMNSFARKLEAAAIPQEASQPWLSCGEAGCP